jgi:hypothetical protein
MFRALRSRRFPLLVLAVFLVAQPVVGCVALCLFEHHEPAAHPASAGPMTMGGSVCHTGAGGAVQRLSIQVPAPVDTSRAPTLVAAPDRRVEPLRSRPNPLRPTAPSLDPPPPRRA